MQIIRVTKEEWLEIMRMIDDGANPVEIVYEIIDDDSDKNEESENQ